MKQGGLTSGLMDRTLAPASAFKHAPSFGSGGVSGGMPAILHKNEAVIPLSKGRKVPVDMGEQGKSGDTIIQYTINTPDAESFRRSQGQIMARTSRDQSRANSRNN